MFRTRNAALAAGGLVFALTSRPLYAQAKSGDIKGDSRFIRELASDNLLEVRQGQLAEKKASNSDVKKFGERMVTDHTKLEDEVTSLASKNGMQFKPVLGPKHESKLDRLEKLSGKGFDRAYMSAMVREHTDDVDYVQNEAKSAHSSEVRDLASKALPTLQDHLSQAKQVAAKVGADTTATARHVTASRNKPK
jgi:putative membrane protein